MQKYAASFRPGDDDDADEDGDGNVVARPIVYTYE